MSVWEREGMAVITTAYALLAAENEEQPQEQDLDSIWGPFANES